MSSLLLSVEQTVHTPLFRYFPVPATTSDTDWPPMYCLCDESDSLFTVCRLCRHLEYNNLVEVNSGSLYGLTALHQLHLSNNSISRIHRDGWSFCQKLHEL